jgi:hypothetical protein
VIPNGSTINDRLSNKTLSDAVGQCLDFGRKFWVNKAYSLPRINLKSVHKSNETHIKWVMAWVILASMLSNNTAVQIHHIFLSETDMEKIEKVLFERSNALPEALEDCDMIKYGDDISFYAKLKVILEKL